MAGYSKLKTAKTRERPMYSAGSTRICSSMFFGRGGASVVLCITVIEVITHVAQRSWLTYLEDMFLHRASWCWQSYLLALS